MPDIKTIDRIKETVNQLGDEPAILEEAGIVLEDITPPQSEISDDLDEMLDEGLQDLGNLDDRLAQDEDEADLFSDLDEAPPTDMSDSLDLPEGQLDIDPVDFPDELDSLNDSGALEDLDSVDDLGVMEDLDSVDDIETMEDLGGADDLGAMEDLGSADDLAAMEDLGGADDFGAMEDLGGADDFGAMEDLGGADDLGAMEDLGGADDLGAMEDLGGADDLGAVEDLGGLDDLDAEGDLGGMEELGISDDLDSMEPLGEEINLDEAPDINQKLESLSTDLEESEISGEMDEDLSVSDDFGLNELGEDFLDDFDDDDSEGSFSLDDLGQEFRLEEDDESSNLEMELDSLEQSIDDASSEHKEEEFELTSDEMNQLKEELYRLPRNLKIELEEFMADPATAVEDLNRVIDMLLQRVPVTRVASKVGKLRNKKISIPKGYQKLNVEEFQKERSSLATQFREKVVPTTLTFIGGFLALWLLFLISFNWIYRPIKATMLYRTGYELIAIDQYDQGDYYFDQAYFGWKIASFSVKGWPRKEWFYQYADQYRGRRKYDRAARQYQLLLNAYPSEKQARLDYADLLSNNMARYEDAEKILLMARPIYLEEVAQGMKSYDQVPVNELAEIRDYDMLLALGDTYFLWGEVDPEKFEEARFIYAHIIATVSGSDEVHLRMLRYMLRMNITDGVERYIGIYKEKEKIYTDPYSQAEIYSELAGWLLDRNRNAESEVFLRKAIEVDKTVPDVHYQYSRYFRNLRSLMKEKEALTNALGYLSRVDSNQKKYVHMRIDSYRRLGDILLRQGDAANAEKDYLLALSIFEDARDRNLIGSSEDIGELYSKIADLNFREYRNYETALLYYKEAERNFYNPPDVQYRMGYIYYTHLQNYDKALLEFYQASRALTRDRNLMFAMANTLYQRQDYFGSVSSYERLLTDLREEEQSIGFLVPDQKEEHLSLLIQLMKVYNNLGTAQYRAADRSPSQGSESESLSYYTYSSEYYDRITRDLRTLVRSENNDMAYDNRMALLKERNRISDEMDILIYPELQMELDSLPLVY